MGPETDEIPETHYLEVVPDWTGTTKIQSQSPEIMSSNESGKLKSIRRRVDIHLVFPLGVLYTMAFLDRSNLGNVSAICRTLILHI